MFIALCLCGFSFTAAAATDDSYLPSPGGSKYEHVVERIPLHVYSYYRNNHLGYTYTTSDKERQEYANAGYRYEGIVTHLATQPLPGTYGLYRMLLFPDDRYLAVGKDSRDACIAKYGYVSEGVLGYVYPANVSEGDVNIHSWYHGAPGRYHYYLGGPAYLTDRQYEGVVFRAWSYPHTLQGIRIVAPNTGGTYKVNGKLTIQWESTLESGLVSFHYAVKENSNCWKQEWLKIADQLPPNGSYEWTIPKEAAGEITILQSGELKAWMGIKDLSLIIPIIILL